MLYETQGERCFSGFLCCIGAKPEFQLSLKEHEEQESEHKCKSKRAAQVVELVLKTRSFPKLAIGVGSCRPS